MKKKWFLGLTTLCMILTTLCMIILTVGVVGVGDTEQSSLDTQENTEQSSLEEQEKRIEEAQDRVDNNWTQANEEAEDDLDYYLTDAYKTWESIKKGYTPSQNGD